MADYQPYEKDISPSVLEVKQMLACDQFLTHVSAMRVTGDCMTQLNFYRGQYDPSRMVSFNRFLEPQILGGPFRPGNRRGKWTEHVLATAMTIFNDHFFRGEGGQRDVKNKICKVANDRVWWSRALGETRGRWRPLRLLINTQNSPPSKTNVGIAGKSPNF